MIPQSATSALPLTQAENLAEAFRIFNQASAELTDAYSGLQNQVAHLTEELAEANGELRRQYQEKARLSERLALLLNALPAGVVVLDHDGQVEQCNPAAQAAFGPQLEGRAWSEIFAERTTQTETTSEWSTGSGTHEQRFAVAETELDSAGGRIVLLHDVTAAHAMKRQAERHERLAAMGEMAAALAHQLRTPLAAALLYTGNLTRPDLGVEERAQLADKAIARLKHLERLIKDMLIFARGEVAGREWFEPYALVAEVAQVVEPLARDRMVTFVVEDASAGARIHGDRKALAGSLINLLENALQACEAGGRVEFSAAVGDNQVSFAVRDDGRGIDPQVRQRLFEPFFTTRASGTGLGLAIVRGVVCAHGGTVELAPTPSGSEFVVNLPCQRQGGGAAYLPVSRSVA